MISLAADLYRVYRLENGQITQHLQSDPGKGSAPMREPDAGTPMQIACSRTSLYALMQDGSIQGRLTADGAEWSEILGPSDTTWITTSERYLFALAGDVSMAPLATGARFGPGPKTPARTTLVQLDHDESLLYGLTDDGRVLLRRKEVGLGRGGWHEYPPLGGAVEVVSATDRTYVRTNQGEIYRSQTFGRGGWERLGVDDALALAVSADHDDTLYVATASGVYSVPSHTWEGKGVVRAWVAADWVSEDWVEVA